MRDKKRIASDKKEARFVSLANEDFYCGRFSSSFDSLANNLHHVGEVKHNTYPIFLNYHELVAHATGFCNNLLNNKFG